MKNSLEFVGGITVLVLMAATLMQIIEPTALSDSLSVYEESEIILIDTADVQPANSSTTTEETNVLLQPLPEQPQPKPVIAKPVDPVVEPVVPAGTIFCPEEVQADLMCLEVYEPVCGTMKSDCIGTSCAVVTKTFGNGCGACQNIEVFSYIPGECGGGFATY